MAMNDQSTDEFSFAKDKLASHIKTVIADGEDLLKAAVNVSESAFAVAREKLDHQLASAGTSLANASRPAVDKVRRGAAAANDYVRGNPWTVIAAAVAAGAIIGFLATRRDAD